MGANCLDINWLNLFLCPSCPNWIVGGNGLTNLSSCWLGLLELPLRLLGLLLATNFLLGSLSILLPKFGFERRVNKKKMKRVLRESGRKTLCLRVCREMNWECEEFEGEGVVYIEGIEVLEKGESWIGKRKRCWNWLKSLGKRKRFWKLKKTLKIEKAFKVDKPYV